MVYARVSRSHRDMEPELSCVNGTSWKSDGLGQLPVEGNILRCSIGLCRKYKRHTLDYVHIIIIMYILHRLLSSSCAVLEALGKYFKFELTVGLNGRVWVNSASVVHVIAITNAILNSEYKTPEECQVMVDSIAEKL